MLNLFQHPTRYVTFMRATSPVRSRNKFGMTCLLQHATGKHKILRSFKGEITIALTSMSC